MSYFDNAKKKEKVFGMVFGAGEISEVYEDSHYKIMVEFKNGHQVPYTEEGIPGSYNFKEQTLFYKNDIDLTELDFSAITKVLSPKKIIKFRENKKLEVRLPSGVWVPFNKSSKQYGEEMLEAGRYHLFRKKAKRVEKKVG